jgi:hypothetical protein
MLIKGLIGAKSLSLGSVMSVSNRWVSFMLQKVRSGEVGRWWRELGTLWGIQVPENTQPSSSRFQPIILSWADSGGTSGALICKSLKVKLTVKFVKLEKSLKLTATFNVKRPVPPLSPAPASAPDFAPIGLRVMNI